MILAAIRKHWWASLAISILIASSPLFWIKNRYHNLFLPDVTIDGIEVGDKTKDEVRTLLDNTYKDEVNQTVTLVVDDIKVSTPAADLGFKRWYNGAIDEAYAVGRRDFFFNGLKRVLSTNNPKVNSQTDITFDREKVTALVHELADKVDTKDADPFVTMTYSGSPNSVTVFPGKEGRKVQVEQTVDTLLLDTNRLDAQFTAMVASTSTKLTEDQVKASTERAKKYAGKQLIFRADNVVEFIPDQELVKLLNLPDGYNEAKLEKLISTWKKSIDRPPQEPELEYDTNTLQVKKFTPPRKGLGVDMAQAKEEFAKAMHTLETTEEKTIEQKLPVAETEPTKKLSDTNNLGIKERIGFGESKYEHSIPNRIHNVALTASRITNTIVKPGEEFSFNKTLGDVSGATGFRSAYVIRNGKTELGDGGGVCQVSTTLFRALLNGGIPITKRKAHSYRVSYYELNSKPGVDATVYSGEVDLRFINDTGHHLIIHAETDSDKLYMNVEIYGTSDGRTAEIVDHKTWDFRGAPAPLYIDDPTIPRGRVKQIDFAASGIKASFKNVVKDKDGKVIREDEYYSNYVPWRAVYLRGV